MLATFTKAAGRGLPDELNVAPPFTSKPAKPLALGFGRYPSVAAPQSVVTICIGIGSQSLNVWKMSPEVALTDFLPAHPMVSTSDATPRRI